MRRTKIVATLGPKSWDEPVLRQLVRAGIDVARLNFSHGDHDRHGQTLRLLRRIAGEERRAVAVLQDLGGPKIRTGMVKDLGRLELRDGKTITLVGGLETADESSVGVTLATLASECTIGSRIFLDDGRLELGVERIDGPRVHCTIIRGGHLTSKKGVNLPGSLLSGVPALTAKDRKDLAWGIANGVDYIGLSFVRRPEDVIQAKALIRELKGQACVIAKIEKPQALECLDAIVDAADGVMVARGDLGVELEPERVPLVQKDIISICNAKERPVITATQMLESMVSSPRPTRAEVSDVANAIFDGTDAVMLSGETANGEFPVESVQMMARIAVASDGHIERNLEGRHRERFARPDTVPEAVGRAAELMARELGVKVIVAAAVDGASALGISKSRPDAAILALTPDLSAVQRMALYWGVHPVLTPRFSSRAELVQHAEREVLARGLASPGQIMVLVSNSPLDAPGDPNNLRLHKIGSPHTGMFRIS